jgi:hypothetical protein
LRDLRLDRDKRNLTGVPLPNTALEQPAGSRITQRNKLTASAGRAGTSFAPATVARHGKLPDSMFRTSVPAGRAFLCVTVAGPACMRRHGTAGWLRIPTTALSR